MISKVRVSTRWVQDPIKNRANGSTILEDRESILITAKIDDMAEQVRSGHTIKNTSFYDPASSKIAEQRLLKHHDIDFIRHGGYEGAERTFFTIFPSYMEAPDANFIQAVGIHWNPQYFRIDHRDILGSIIGLGIKREKIGDILVGPDSAYVFIFKQLAPYLKDNMGKIGKVPVNTEIMDCGDVPVFEQKVRTIRTTVASPRLDSIAGACFGLSRSKILPYIEQGRVNVNWDTVTKPDFLLSPGDMLSVRGLGRGRVREFGHTTKKDRLSVVLERFL